MLLVLSCSGIAMAQTSTTAPAAPSPVPPSTRCAVEPTHQFDFWLGDWDVFTPDGKLAGTNLVTAMYKGCVLHESWKTPTMEGESFNRYDVARGVWHQTWVDSSGGILLLEGKFTDGVMTLSDATLPGKPDAKKINEVAWNKQADGSVRQHWRVSRDGGATWSTVFDGKYVKVNRAHIAPKANGS